MARKHEASAREQLGVSLSAALEFSCRRVFLSVSMPRCLLRTISLLFYYLVSSALNLCMHAARLNAMVHGGCQPPTQCKRHLRGALPVLCVSTVQQLLKPRQHHRIPCIRATLRLSFHSPCHCRNNVLAHPPLPYV